MPLFSRARQELIQLNLFADATTLSSGNEAIRRDQILATRVYLSLLISILSVLVLFTCLSTQNVLVTIPKPSIDMFTKLDATYSQTLSCPCQQIAVPYSSFLSIASTGHPVSVHQFSYVSDSLMKEIYLRVLTHIRQHRIKSRKLCFPCAF